MNREKFLPAITLALCLLATFLFVNLIYAPIKSETAAAQLESRRLHAVEKNLQEFKNRHGDIEKFLALTETRLKSARELLPLENSQDTFAAEIYKTAEKNKVLVTSVQMGELEPVESAEGVENVQSAEGEGDTKILRQSVKIKVEADYIATLNFLRDILNGERFTALETITLASDKNILTGDIEILIFNLAAPS
ncbi:MAG: hypothetical protein IJU91_01300 [Selenomonadaceae bacterium]|nr:hypothetical protein [Selenomonadaceae bacterium]